MTIEIVSFPMKNKVMFHSYVAVYQRVYGGFHKWGYPQARWMVYFMENPINMNDLRVPPFQETSIDNQENVG